MASGLGEEHIDRRAAEMHRRAVADAGDDVAQLALDAEMAPAGCDIDRAAGEAFAVINFLIMFMR